MWLSQEEGIGQSDNFYADTCFLTNKKSSGSYSYLVEEINTAANEANLIPIEENDNYYLFGVPLYRSGSEGLSVFGRITKPVQLAYFTLNKRGVLTLNHFVTKSEALAWIKQ